MAAKKEDVSYFSLMTAIKAHKFSPIYILHGEEAYYIDQLQQAIIDNALTPDEQAFNLTIAYGSDIPEAKPILTACKQYPSFSQYQVIVVREAQNMGKNSRGNATELNLFKTYAERPVMSTILVICFKGGTIKAKELTDAVKKNKTGVIFESAKLRDGRPVEQAAANYAKSIGCNIDDKSASMLASNIGNDISRLFGEIDKLKLLVGNDNRITPELIERNIGISKDYNYWELEDAIIKRDAAKAYRIVDYYERNPKNNPVVLTISMLFSFFASVLLVQTSKDRSPAALMAAAGTKSQFRLSKFEQAARNYSKIAVVNTISNLRRTDVMSKGIGSRQDAYRLLNELIYKIMHA
ncbi:MAG: DNA polymerase III subunit delta [Muribaculaceae bacterium]|nr:DNA polymerase III subunit delta [Muribaculaceae bacterium]